MTLTAAGAGQDPERVLMDQLREVLRDLHGVLALRDRDHLPPPTRRVEPSTARHHPGILASGGVEWFPVDHWEVKIPLEDDDLERFVYVHSPEAMFACDVVPLRVGDARALGLALLAAADWASNELWRR